jgi:hypothetical protein
VPIIDEGMRETFLNVLFRGASAPANWEVALFAGDPTLDGVEISAITELEEGGTEANGYARVTVANDATFWAAAGAGGMAGYLTSLAPVQFPTVTSSEGYDDEVTHWALFDPVSGLWGPCAELAEPLNVTAAGDGPAVSLTIFFDDSVEVPA